MFGMVLRYHISNCRILSRICVVKDLVLSLNFGNYKLW